jgi:hypothetical protein
MSVCHAVDLTRRGIEQGKIDVGAHGNSEADVWKINAISFGPMCLLRMPVSRGHEECSQLVPNTTARQPPADKAVYHIPYVKAKEVLR